MQSLLTRQPADAVGVELLPFRDPKEVAQYLAALPRD